MRFHLKIICRNLDDILLKFSYLGAAVTQNFECALKVISDFVALFEKVMFYLTLSEPQDISDRQVTRSGLKVSV